MISIKQYAILALAGHVLAQSPPTLQQALSSSPDLSRLSALLPLAPKVVQSLTNAQNITILAPSNAAFARLDDSVLTSLAADVDLLTALLQYHVLNKPIYSSQIPETTAFVPTLLTDSRFTNVTGGQRVGAQSRGGKVTIFSGLLSNSTVTQANVNFTGGVIHVIDSILTLPDTAANTLNATGLTSLRDALVKTNLASTVNTTPNITIFAPNNAAFQSISSTLSTLSTDQVSKILTYHVVVGSAPGYSSGLQDGTTLKTVNGASLAITINNGNVFVNGVRVVTPDVLVANGVAHVIEGVLNPDSSTSAKPSASTAATSAAATGPAASGTSATPPSITGGASMLLNGRAAAMAAAVGAVVVAFI